MAVSRDGRPTRLRSILAAVLTVLILVPTGILFAQAWQRTLDERTGTQLERHGVEYLTALLPLVSALAEAQTSALQGISGSPTALGGAVAQVAAVDQRLGSELRVRERWNGLRGEIERLPSVAGSATTVFQTYAEVTDLALALSAAVRDNAELSRDQDNDVSHLQQAVAADLPGTIVQVSRMGDLALVLADGDQALQRVLGPPFGAAAIAQDTLVNSLTDHLQAAVVDTNSPTLSGNLVTTLDEFRRGVETLNRGANTTGEPNAAVISTAQGQLQSALSALAGVLLREINALLSDRLDRLGRERAQLLAVAASALVLTVLALALFLVRGRRRSAAPETGPPGRDPGDGPGGGDILSRPAAFGPADPTRRERSGALR